MNKRSLLSSNRIRIGFCLLVSLSLGLASESVFGQKIQSPPKGVDGYTISIKDQWVSSQGFRPIRVTVATNPAKATVDDERFEVVIVNRVYNGADQRTTGQLVIPAGQKSATIEIYVNDMYSMNAASSTIQVFRKGRRLTSQTGWTPQYGVLPTILMIGDEFPLASQTQKVVYGKKTLNVPKSTIKFTGKTPLPSLDKLVMNYDTGALVQAARRFLPNGTVIQTPAQTAPATTGVVAISPWNTMNSQTQIHYSHPDDLPASWIGYQGVEMILISYSQLKNLLKNPVHQDNLEKWIVTGGSLIVCDTGPDFKNAKEIWPMLVGPEQRKSPRWQVPGQTIKDLYKLLPVNRSNEYYYGLDEQIFYSTEEAYQVDGRGAVIAEENWDFYDSPDQFPTVDDKAKKQIATLFGICNYIDGRIVAVSDDMSKWKPNQWMLLHNSVVGSGRSVSQTVCAVSPASNTNQNNFSIPGVGEPPTTMFQILIGLFLLIAGPVAMIFLKRVEKMHYLFVGIPLLSAAVCASLFSYALIADGSNRWGRANSITHLDHRSNMAVTHTRAMYYSGSNPGVYPMPEDGLGIQMLNSDTRAVQSNFQDGMMSLSGGDIVARVPHEITSARPYTAKERLLVIPVDQEESSGSSSKTKITRIKVQNRLGAKVKLAIVKTGDKYYRIDDLEAGETVEVENDKKGIFDASARLMYELSPPVLGEWGKYDRYSNRGIAASSYEELQLGELNRVELIVKGGNVSKLLYAPNCYVAILEELPMVSSQIEPVEYKLQCHVVRGKW